MLLVLEVPSYLFLKLKKEKKQLTITDKKMTRFFTSLEDAVKMVWKGLKVMKGGEVYVLKTHQ